MSLPRGTTMTTASEFWISGSASVPLSRGAVSTTNDFEAFLEVRYHKAKLLGQKRRSRVGNIRAGGYDAQGRVGILL